MFVRLSSIFPSHFILTGLALLIVLTYWLGLGGFLLAIVLTIFYYAAYIVSVLRSARRKMITMNQILFSCLGVISRHHPLDFDQLANMPFFYVPKSVRSTMESNFCYARDNDIPLETLISKDFLQWVSSRPQVKLVFAKTLLDAIPQSLWLDAKVVNILRSINIALGAADIRAASEFVIDGEIIPEQPARKSVTKLPDTPQKDQTK